MSASWARSKLSTAAAARSALRFADREISWRDLRAQIEAAADAMRRTRWLRPGDRVAILLPNSPDWIVAYWAVMSAGLVAVPLNLRWSSDYLTHALRRVGCAALLVDPAQLPEVAAHWAMAIPADATSSMIFESVRLVRIAVAKPRPLVDESWAVGPPADIVFTAGTTGLPVPIVHPSSFYDAQTSGRRAFLGIDDTDVGLAVSPLFHVGGIQLMMLAICGGGTLSLMPRWDPHAFLSTVVAHGVTYVHLVGTAVVDVANLAVDGREPISADAFRLTLSGGSSLSLAHIERYEWLTGSLLIEGYGRTEGGVSWNPPTASARRVGSLGLPLTDVAELGIIDPGTGRQCGPNELGEIRLRGAGVSSWTWGNPPGAGRDTDGWFRTGDMALQDKDGYLYFRGRADGMIKSGGENVSPIEVERVLLEMPGVREAAVVGLPDERLGQLVSAVVATDASATVEDITRWSRSRLAGFQVPRVIHITKSVPRLGSNKIDYGAVRETLEKGNRTMNLPTYADLKQRTDAPAGSSWGLLGDLGTIARIGPEQARRAATLVRTGDVFSLDWPINAFDPPLSPARHIAKHVVYQRNPNHRDDYLDGFYLQGTTQLDGLRHQRHATAGFYNFARDEDVHAGSGPIGIEQWAAHGIVGRGILIDVDRFLRANRGSGLDHRGGEPFAPEVLDQTLAWQGVELEYGDIVLIRTGWAEFYFAELTQAERDALPGNYYSPGLEQSEASLAWLWDSGAGLVATDNIGVEVLPVVPGSPFIDIDPTGMMHAPMIALLGLALGELLKLDVLGTVCAADRRYEMLVSCAPLNLLGGVGSPANGIAVR